VRGTWQHKLVYAHDSVFHGVCLASLSPNDSDDRDRDRG
jgi:hypothetical protein